MEVGGPSIYNQTNWNKVINLMRIVTSKRELWSKTSIFLHKKHQNKPPNQKVVLLVAPFFKRGQNYNIFQMLALCKFCLADRQMTEVTVSTNFRLDSDPSNQRGLSRAYNIWDTQNIWQCVHRGQILPWCKI
jgi:hypothetical protein